MVQGSGGSGGAVSWRSQRDRGALRAVPAGGCGRHGGGAGCELLPGSSGGGPGGVHGSLVWDGLVALVPVSVGGRDRLGPGVSCGRPSFLSVVSSAGQAIASAVACPRSRRRSG